MDNICNYVISHDKHKKAFRIDGVEYSYYYIVNGIRNSVNNLLKNGLVQGDVVLILDNTFTIDFIIIFLALQSIGVVVFLPRSGMSIFYFMKSLKRVNFKRIILSKRMKKVTRIIPTLWMKKKLFFEDFVFVNSQQDPYEESFFTNLDVNLSSFLTFTSGTTGLNKLNNRTLINDIATFDTLSKILSKGCLISDFRSFSIIAICLGLETIVYTDKDKQDQMNSIYDYLKSNNPDNILLSTECLVYIIKRLIMEDDQTIRFKTKCLLFGGDAVGIYLLKNVKKYFEYESCIVLYGTSEAEPVSHLHIDEILAKESLKKFNGYLVGKVTDNTLQIKDGFVHVSGPHVVKEYYNDHINTQKAKHIDENGVVWHNTTDNGFIDSENYLWLTGRKDNHTYLFESEVNKIDGVFGCCMHVQSGTFYVAIESFNVEIKIVHDLMKEYVQDTFKYKVCIRKKLPRTKTGKFDRKRCLEIVKTKTIRLYNK